MGSCNHMQRIYVCKASICAESRQRSLRQLCQAENRGGGELPANNSTMLNDNSILEFSEQLYQTELDNI